MVQNHVEREMTKKLDVILAQLKEIMKVLKDIRSLLQKMDGGAEE